MLSEGASRRGFLRSTWKDLGCLAREGPPGTLLGGTLQSDSRLKADRGEPARAVSSSRAVGPLGRWGLAWLGRAAAGSTHCRRPCR
jgi:hypothetical protein